MPPFNDHVANLADDYVHRLLNASRATEVERHCAACPVCKAAVDDARLRFAALRAEPPAEASEELVRKTIGKIDAHQKARQRRWRLFLAGAGGLLAASVVVLVWLHVYYFNLAATPYDLVVLGQRQLLASANGSLRVVLRDAKTLAPVAGVPVTVRLVGRDNKQTADLAAFKTDADGGGDPRFTLPDWADQACDLIVEAQTAGAPEKTAQSVELKRSFKVMLTTDKPVYQPGQTIHTRALALRRPDLHPVADQAATFSVVDPKGNIIFKQEDKTSKYGVTAADCPLDTEILEGPYTVLCKTGDVESRLSVDVKKYVLPKFKVTVTPDRPFYKHGDTIKLAVQADYFFGKPVAASAVDVDVTTDFAGPQPAHLGGRTDDKGAVSFDYAIPRAVNGQPSDLSHVHFQAAVADPAGQKQTASVDSPVAASPARIEVIPEAGELVRGVSNTIYVLVTRIDGTPAQHAHVTLIDLDNIPNRLVPDQKADADDNGAASFSIVPVGQSTPWGAQMSLEVVAVDDQGAEIARRGVRIPCGPAGDFLVRTDRAVYKGGDTLTLTAVGGGSGAVFVDFIKDGQTMRTETVEMANGQGQAAVDLPADLSGTMQVVAYRLDAKGYPVRKTRVVYVRPADEIHIAATLNPDKKAYKPGEHPTLHLKLTDKNGKPCPGAVSLSGVDDAVFSVLPQRPGMEEAFYTLEEDLMAPVNRIHPWSPNDAGSQRFQQALFAAASRADNPPQDDAGPPIPGEAIKAARAGRPRVLGDALPMAPLGTTHSLVAETYQTKVQETAKERQEGLDRMKWLWLLLIPAAFGVTILGFWLFGQSSVLVKCLITGYAVIPVALIGLAAFFWRGRFDSNLLQSAFGRNSPPMSEAAPEFFNQAKEVLGANPMMDPAAAPEEMGGRLKPGGGEATPPRVRQLFPETLLWRPEIVTDDAGEATLPLDLADSITTWRLSASAVSGDGKLGAAQLPVKVFQDFFVDLNLPVALTRGDEIGVPVVVYNYLDKPQTVTLTLAEDKEKWFTRLDGAEQRLDLGPNEVRSVRYRLKVEKVGAWTLTVKAQGATDADAVQRPIEVLPDGRRVEEVVNGTLEKPADVALTLPEDTIPGSAKAFVKIYPSSFSQLVEGLDNIFRMPGGCFEQTSSTTYPNVLALDYLKRTGQNAPGVRAKAEGYIRYGYQRLLSFEVGGGGFEWFGRAPANRTLTAYGLMEFTDMARVEDVDPNVIARTRSWLLGQRRPDGSWDPEAGRMLDEDLGGVQASEDARLSATAYIGWAVFGDPGASGQADATFNYLKRHAPETIKDAPHPGPGMQRPAGRRRTERRRGAVPRPAGVDEALRRGRQVRLVGAAGRRPDDLLRRRPQRRRRDDGAGDAGPSPGRPQSRHDAQGPGVAHVAEGSQRHLVLDAGHSAGTEGAAGGDRQTAGRRGRAHRRAAAGRRDDRHGEDTGRPGGRAEASGPVGAAEAGQAGADGFGSARLGDRFPGVVPLQRAGGRPGRADRIRSPSI